MHLVTRLAAALFSGAWYRAAQTLPLVLVYRQAVRAAQTVTLVYRQALRAKQTLPVTLVYRRAVVQPKYQLSR